MIRSSADREAGRLLKAACRRKSPRFWRKRRRSLSLIKRRFQSAGQDSAADLFWYLETFCEASEYFTKAIEAMSVGAFRFSWDLLERSEISLLFLSKNPICAQLEAQMLYLQERVLEFQKLFPYKLFISPEMVIGRHDCEICGDQMPPAGNCPHRTGRVYSGRLCVRTARDVQFLGVSLVTKPVQKYSVVFSGNDTSVAYEPIRYVLKVLDDPYARWWLHETTARWPHAFFADVKDTDLCPCESGGLYASCCKTKEGVIMPHLSIELTARPKAKSNLSPVLLRNGTRYIGATQT